jgi:D-alanine-D-alanine ligase
MDNNNVNNNDKNDDVHLTNGNNNGSSNGNGTVNGYKLPSKVAILYTDAKRDYFPTEALYITEKDAPAEASIIASYVEKLGIECKTFPGDQNLIENLKEYKPEMVFNLVYSVKGSDYSAGTVPAILDFLEIPYTGADFFGFAFNADKFLVKQVLQRAGVPVPTYQLFNTPNDPIDYNLKFPLISKLNEVHCGVEITRDSISENEKHLRERLRYLISTYKQPVVVEEFIAGREVTAILLEGMHKKVYFGEKVFQDKEQKYNFTTFEDQWMEDTTAKFTYEKYEDPVLREYVKKAFVAARMFDYAKFDIRIDYSGRYYFIDANCNPAFGPRVMMVAISSILHLYGISFYEILRRVIINTLYENSGDYKQTLPSEEVDGENSDETALVVHPDYKETSPTN